MTKVVTPFGGDLRWDYRTYAYTGKGRSYREVTTRQMTKASGAAQAAWNVTPVDGATQHGATTVSDLGANSSKVWTFGTSGVAQGLTTSYEERGPGGVALAHTDYTWSADNGNVYVGSVVNTLNPGASQVQSKNTQTLDSAGNLTVSAVYDYGNLATPARTYNYSYLTDANYTNRWTQNRVTQVTMNGTVLVTNTYDGYTAGPCSPVAGLTARTGLALHDDTNFGTGFVYRGNVTQSVSVGGVQCMGYETTGVVTGTMDGAGRFVTSTPSSATNYALPGVLTPGGNGNLATTLTYADSWAVTSLTGPNGANGTTTYDYLGRPQSTKIPDGAETDYTYDSYLATGSALAQQTATLTTGTAVRWKRTSLDGFGRVVRVESGNGAATNVAVSQVDTEYAPCGCSALGKVSRVSMPHAGGTTGSAWTVYGYDGSGRTVTVTAADGSVTRTEYLTVYGSYTGNLVKVTDAAGKWKMQQSNAMGQLLRVIENSGSGADLITNYTYDALGHLTGVSMPRSNGTQTRTFVYTGADLTSATNPENGTVTYQYDGSHRVTKRTDAKGQETRYTYDAYGRLTQVQHWAVSWDAGINNYRFQEQGNQRVTYTYDSNPLNGSYSQNVWGRLATVQFQDENNGMAMSYMYSYNQAGRVTAQHLDYDAGSGNAVSFDAGYTWDTEGRMTGITYGPQYTMTYDANGRLGGMSGSDLTLAASYGVGGEMLGLNYTGSSYLDHYSETRTYNTMLQLTRMTATGTTFTQANNSVTAMDMQYVYTAGANNGRIAQAVDWVGNETVNYGYDGLNRLSSAGATSGSWGQAFTYDGFGNLTGKTVTQGSAPTLGVSFDPATNRQYGLTYDANGNAGTGTYDVENRVIGDSAGTYVYDQAGKRVKKSYGTAEEFYFYGIGGQRLVTLPCTALESGRTCLAAQYNVYFGGKLVKSKGMAVVTDRLGSVRANWAGERMSYYPYGEEKTSTADGREKFGTYTRDNTATDYADQRYYAVGNGRFNSPDPSTGSSAADPGSWNKYAYVGGDPVNFADPSGLNRLMCDVYTDYGCAGSGNNGTPGVGWYMYTTYGPEGSSGGGGFFPGTPGGGGDPIGGSGGGGFVQVQPKVPGGNNYTPAQMQGLTNGLNNALSHTDQVDCATFYAGGDDDPSLAVAKDLENTLYRLLPLPQGPGTGAQTIDLTNVMINTAGAFFNAGANANGTVTVGMPNGAGVQAAFTFANMSTFQGFILLHELGHQTGVFGPDVDAAANGTNSQAVLDHCFKTDAQGVWH